MQITKEEKRIEREKEQRTRKFANTHTLLYAPSEPIKCFKDLYKARKEIREKTERNSAC